MPSFTLGTNCLCLWSLCISVPPPQYLRCVSALVWFTRGTFGLLAGGDSTVALPAGVEGRHWQQGLTMRGHPFTDLPRQHREPVRRDAIADLTRQHRGTPDRLSGVSQFHILIRDAEWDVGGRLWVKRIHFTV